MFRPFDAVKPGRDTGRDRVSCAFFYLRNSEVLMHRGNYYCTEEAEANISNCNEATAGIKNSSLYGRTGCSLLFRAPTFFSITIEARQYFPSPLPPTPHSLIYTHHPRFGTPCSIVQPFRVPRCGGYNCSHPAPLKNPMQRWNKPSGQECT